MQKHNGLRERGAVEVEAVIMLPITILSVVMLLYLSLFLLQRANLQAGLETALVYYKNTVTDTYVTPKDKVDYTAEDSSRVGAGNQYTVTGPLSPYRNMFGDGNDLGNQENFEKYFRSIAGGAMLGAAPELTIEYYNYVFLKQLEVTATQDVTFPIDFSMLGIHRKYQISAVARVAVVDHDSTIRNVDYAIDLLEDTKLGEMAKDFAGKISDAYQKLKDFLGKKDEGT